MSLRTGGLSPGLLSGIKPDLPGYRRKNLVGTEFDAGATAEIEHVLALEFCWVEILQNCFRNSELRPS
jgi:hypothetical protein